MEGRDDNVVIVTNRGEAVVNTTTNRSCRAFRLSLFFVIKLSHACLPWTNNPYCNSIILFLADSVRVVY